MKDPVTPLAAVLLCAAASFCPAPSVAAEPTLVVELFTSQGCNSCPPADAVLGQLAKRNDVLPLSFHVTPAGIGSAGPTASVSRRARGARRLRRRSSRNGRSQLRQDNLQQS